MTQKRTSLDMVTIASETETDFIGILNFSKNEMFTKQSERLRGKQLFTTDDIEFSWSYLIIMMIIIFF